MDGSAESAPVKSTFIRPARSRLYPWYDSEWLSDYSRAKAIIRAVKPEALAEFEDAFRILRTPPTFRVRQFDRVFDDAVLGEIRRVVASLRPTDLELHEARSFGRFVVHNHPLFTELQERTISLVSEAAGEPVEAAYNFLGLYANLGVCPPHMDAPKSKWTLDLCVNQSGPWPIYFSEIQDWPEAESLAWEDDWQNQIKRSPSLRFTSHTLQPGQAVIFSGSSQWHYRDAIPPGPTPGFCDLLFFHYRPRGTAEVVKPKNRARLFSMPELDPEVSGIFG